MFSLEELRYEYPDEIVPAGKTMAAYLAELAWAGAHERYPAGLDDKTRDLILHELLLIGQLKIEAYFLTVYDIGEYSSGPSEEQVSFSFRTVEMITGSHTATVAAGRLG